MFFGNAKVGLEVCRAGSVHDLWGEKYIYIGAMWIDSDTEAIMEQHTYKAAIWKSMQGAFGIQNKDT